MVNKNRAGLNEWLIQRATALFIGIYVVWLVGYLWCHAGITYIEWQALFRNGWVCVFTVLAVASILWHAWIGLWTVLTDYIKCKRIRLAVQGILLFVLAGYFVWAIHILWHG